MKLTETNFATRKNEVWFLPTIVLNSYRAYKTKKITCVIITISFIIWNVEIVFDN
jgi:hypothetical protein